MKRIKIKKVWVKRINIIAKNYDFIYTDLENAKHVIEYTANLTSGTKYIKPTKFEIVKLEIEQFVRLKKYEMVFAVLIVLLTVLFERLF